MKVSYVTLDYVNDEGTTETLLGAADDFGDAHAMIIAHIESERARIKAAWYAHFNAVWPGEDHVVELSEVVIGRVVVVTYNHSDVCWYQITK